MPATRNRAPAYVPELDTIAAAARFLRVNERTVRRMVAAGELRGYRVRSALRIDMRQIREEIAQPAAPESISA